MSKGLNFTPDEEAEFKDMVAIRPKGFGQRLSVFFDRVMNSIWTFFVLVAYSLLGAVFPQALTPLLFWSNSYQLSSLPVVAIAAALGTMKLMRLVFRVYLNQKERDEARAKELTIIRDENAKLRQLVEGQAAIIAGQSDLMAEMEEVISDMHQIAAELHDHHIGGREHKGRR